MGRFGLLEAHVYIIHALHVMYCMLPGMEETSSTTVEAVSQLSCMHAWMVHVVLDCFGALVPDEQAEVGGVKVKKTVARTVACRINPARSLFCMHAISYMLPVPCPQDSEDAWKDVLRSQKAQPITHDKTSYIYRVASYIFVFRYRCLRLH